MPEGALVLAVLVHEYVIVSALLPSLSLPCPWHTFRLILALHVDVQIRERLFEDHGHLIIAVGVDIAIVGPLLLTFASSTLDILGHRSQLLRCLPLGLHVNAHDQVVLLLLWAWTALHRSRLSALCNLLQLSVLIALAVSVGLMSL